MKTKAFFSNLLYAFLAPAVFCLYWNVLEVHSAVGLGTVGYLTALGVYYAGACVVGAISFNFWYAKGSAEEIRGERAP